MSYPPDPVGMWHEALEHLAAAEALMDRMEVQYPTGTHTVADYHQLSFDSMRTTVTEHWRHAWWMQAHRPGPVIVVQELPAGVDQAHGQERRQDEQGGQHGRQPGAGPRRGGT